jgi:SSS family solute:Na+ symporter
LQFLDVVIIGVYFLGMLAVGLYFHRRQSDLDEYFVGGRNMSARHIGL